MASWATTTARWYSRTSGVTGVPLDADMRALLPDPLSAAAPSPPAFLCHQQYTIHISGTSGCNETPPARQQTSSAVWEATCGKKAEPAISVIRRGQGRRAEGSWGSQEGGPMRHLIKVQWIPNSRSGLKVHRRHREGMQLKSMQFDAKAWRRGGGRCKNGGIELTTSAILFLVPAASAVLVPSTQTSTASSCPPVLET